MIELLTAARTRKYFVNTNHFLDENDISFYLLGVYMTDGNINTTKHHLNFSISSKDKRWLESIRDLIVPNKPIYNKQGNCFSLEASNIEVLNWLINYGCIPRKSLTLSINKPIPIQYQRDFLRGVVDGDGSMSIAPYIKKKNNKIYHYNKKTMYICSASRIFLEQIKEMIPNNINCYLYNYGKIDSIINDKIVIAKNDIYRLAFNDGYAKKFAEYLYYDNHAMSLERKYQVAKRMQ